MTPDPLLATAVGGTPLVRLERVVPADCGSVWLKLESVNPTGSYKDRMAVSVIERALERGDLTLGDTVVEYTGGSTGMALAFVAARRGLKFVAVSSDAFSAVKLRSMRAYGAEVIEDPSDHGRITPELIARMRERARQLSSQPGHFYADQFGSPDVTLGYRPMGREIAEQIEGRLDVICASVGTGGALMGAVDGLDGAGLHPDVVALEPAQSPLLTTGVGGPHRVEGIGVGFEPPFLDRDRCSEIRTVDELDAMAMARERGPESTVVTFGCDSGTKYLTGDLFG